MDQLAASPSIARRIRATLLGAGEAWLDDRAASKGAALAFYTLFSLTPLLLLIIAIAGLVFGAQAAQGEIFIQLRELMGPAGAEAIQILLAGARNPEAGKMATIVASVLLVIGATSVFAELKDSLDEIWHMPKSRQAGVLNLIRTRLLSFGIVLVLAFLLLVSLVVSAGLAFVERYWLGRWAEAAMVLAALSAALSFVVIACLFAVIYKMLPEAKLGWKDVWIGALGTAILFTVGKYVIGVYLGNSGVASSYGAAGSVVALLLWVYYSAQIFFFGAEFTRQYALCFGSHCPSNRADAHAAHHSSGANNLRQRGGRSMA
jgi:membrane protein